MTNDVAVVYSVDFDVTFTEHLHERSGGGPHELNGYHLGPAANSHSGVTRR